MPIIAKIGTTGGPAGGKTYFTSFSREYFVKSGIKPVYLSEVATLFNTYGIGPTSNILSNLDYQYMIAKFQLSVENNVIESLQKSQENIVIIFDRTILDGKAYCSKEEWDIVLERLKITEQDIYNRYDLILHFVTTAIGKYACYSTENNPARYESKQEAIQRENLNVAAYNGMPITKRIHLNNDVKMEEKQAIAVNTILEFLKLAKPIFGRQQKYLVKKVPKEIIQKFSPKKISIIQDYLHKREDETERRVRCIIDDGSKTYYYTEKTYNENLEYDICYEKQISKEEYYSYLKDKNEKENKTIYKDRWYFEANGLYFQYDEFEFFNELAILEVQPTNICKNVKIPEGFEIVGNVTYLTGILKNEVLSRKSITENELKDIFNIK